MEHIKKSIHLGMLPNGTPIDVMTHTFSSGKPWFKLYIQAGIHGGEITYWILDKLYMYLQEKWLQAGEILIIPIANPLTWNQRLYFYTMGKFDLYMGKDPTLCYPWSPDGYYNQRLCHGLLSLQKQYDFVLDLHTARNAFPFNMMTNAYHTPEVKRASEKEVEYARIMGIEYNLMADDFDEHDSTCAVASLWVPACTLECGSHNKYQPEYIDMVYNGLLRLMSHTWMIEEKFAPCEKTPLKYSYIKDYKAPNWWIVRFYKNIWDTYKKGDLLYDMLNPSSFGSAATPVHAQEDGIIQKISPTHIYWPGDDVITVIPSDAISVL